MAKMFYKLSEAAEKLGVDEQVVRDMAARGELQQFRDRDELMFKRDQVDAKAADSNADTVSADAEANANADAKKFKKNLFQKKKLKK